MVSAEALARATQIIDGLSDEELERLERGEIVPVRSPSCSRCRSRTRSQAASSPSSCGTASWSCIVLLASERRLFVLKARQLGITWTVLAHLLYLGRLLGRPPLLIASQTGDDAAATLQRLRRLYASIPPGWTPRGSSKTTPPDRVRQPQPL